MPTKFYIIKRAAFADQGITTNESRKIAHRVRKYVTSEVEIGFN